MNNLMKKNQKESKPEIQVNFRMPSNTHKKAKLLAVESGIGLNKMLALLLDAGLKATLAGQLPNVKQ